MPGACWRTVLALLLVRRTNPLLLSPPAAIYAHGVRRSRDPTWTQLRRQAPTSMMLGPLAPIIGSVAQARSGADVSIRGASAADAAALADLCTNTFYGTHAFEDGPIIFLQRSQIYAKVLTQVERRIRIESGRECRLLVAEDLQTGEVLGCIDLAVHLFNRR